MEDKKQKYLRNSTNSDWPERNDSFEDSDNEAWQPMLETLIKSRPSSRKKWYCCFGVLRWPCNLQSLLNWPLQKGLLFLVKIFLLTLFIGGSTYYTLYKFSFAPYGIYSITLENYKTIGRQDFIPQLRIKISKTDQQDRQDDSSLSISVPDVFSWAFRLNSDSENDLGAAENTEVCPKLVLFEIQADLSIPDLYSRITFPDPKTGQPLKTEVSTPENTSFIINSKTNETKWSKDHKLKIYVVPHSHNDAGWGETFKDYYNFRTKSILDNLLKYLTDDPELKFIWCEISFFELWWKELSDNKRLQVQKLVDNKQLEFVGGGWVMPDEATTHYLSLVTQIIEGHQWLHHHLNYTPSNGWAVDPFGLSSTANFIYQRSGLKNTVFSRTHYLLLKLLREQKETEIYWRQPWDTSGTTDIFCYLMPYGTYDGRGTCGPDFNKHGVQTQVCRSYSPNMDRQPTGMSDEEDVERRAMLLMNQYRKKAMLFNTNNLFIPIGGDFTWQTTAEWTDDIQMLKRIFKYINSSEDLNTEIKFATLNEYFDAVHADEVGNNSLPAAQIDTINRTSNNSNWTPKKFSGDFFTYSDTPNDYWSGYYTSRIFHKASERQLMALIRSSQLIYSIMAGEISRNFKHAKFNFIGQMLKKIVESRRTLSLFQHHDGITGTSTDRVVRDYAILLYTAMYNCHSVIQQCTHILQSLQLDLKHQQNDNKTADDPRIANNSSTLESKFARINTSDRFYEPIMNKSEPYKVWEDNVYTIDTDHPVEVITVFNSLAKRRKQVVRVCVTNADVKVLGANDTEEVETMPIPSEINPVFKYFERFKDDSKELRWNQNWNSMYKWSHDSRSYAYHNPGVHHSTTKKPVGNKEKYLESYDYFELVFIVDIGPLEIKHFKIVYDSQLQKTREGRTPHIRVFNTKTQLSDKFTNVFKTPVNLDEKSVSSVNKQIKISSNYLTVNFNDNGAAKSVELQGAVYPLNIAFHFYETKRSGLYSFSPLGEDEPITKFMSHFEPIVIVVEGKLRSYVEVWLPNVRHRLTLFNHDGLEGYGFHIENTVDIREKVNYELIMKVSTGIESKNLFYTDSNGFQMMRRENRKNFPTQGNYYPIASSAYIEDPKLRLTLLAAQPGGGASRVSGQLEVMLDRKIHQDDNHGIGQGGTDNLLTVLSFQLILEKVVTRKNCSKKKTDQKQLDPLPLLSLSANLQQLNLLHPLLVYRKLDLSDRSHPGYTYTTTTNDRPISCDTHLLGAIPFGQISEYGSDQNNFTDSFENRSNQTALLFHRMGFDPRFRRFASQSNVGKYCAPTGAETEGGATKGGPSFGQINIENLFNGIFKNQLVRTCLSLSHKDKITIINGTTTLQLVPMEIHSFIANYNLPVK